MRVDQARNECVCTIVYFGPGLSGKSSNLTWLARHLQGRGANELQHHDRDGERLLFASIALAQPQVAGKALRVELLTLPGRSYVNTNRRGILEGADGVVFVADSRREAIDENIDAMNDMWAFIHEHGLTNNLPLVIQFNKQDLPSSLSLDQLSPLLNSQNYPAFAAVANQGTGVRETFTTIVDRVVRDVTPEQLTQANASQSNRLTAEISGNRARQEQDEQEAEETWLLTCCSCEAVLEVGACRPGDLFTCGSCNTVISVVDRETGSTALATQTQANNDISDRYATLPDPQAGALGSDFVYQDPQSHSIVRDLNDTSPSGQVQQLPTLPGHQFLDQLDSSLVGTRYRVHDQARNRALRALVLNPLLVKQPGYREGIEHHLRLASGVRHPNLVPLTALRWWRDLPIVLSLDTPDYEPLSVILARRRTLAPPQAMGIIRQLSLALEEASRQGLTHGWLRPEIILVSPSGNVLLDDLAVPKLPGFLVRESMGGSAATEYYLAPEMLSTETAIDTRTDIFLLGAILFRMVSGVGMVTGYSAHEALHRISTSGPRRLRESNPEISRELDAFCQQLCAVERKDRIQQHSDLLAQLEKFGGGAKRNTLRASRHPNTAKVSRRRVGGAANLGMGSGNRPPAKRRNSLPTGSPSGYGESQRNLPRRPEPQRSPVFLIILLILAAVAALLFVFRDRFINAYQAPQRNNVYATVPSNAPATPTPTASTPTPTDRLSRATALVDRFEANPQDRQAYTDAKDLIVLLRQEAPTRIQATALDDRLRSINERLTLGIPVRSADGAPTALPGSPRQPNPNATSVGESKENLAQVRIDISSRLREERFGAALELVHARIADPSQVTYYQEAIAAQHLASRKAVRDRLAQATTKEEARSIVAPAYETWGMLGDSAWADTALAEFDARLASTPDSSTAVTATPRIPEASAPTPQGTSAQTIDGISLDVLTTNLRLDEALRSGDTARARVVLRGRQADDYQAAMQLKLQLLEQAPQALSGPFAERKPKVRVKTPFADQQWDVAAIEAGGLRARSPKDELTNIAWPLLDMGDVARVYQAVASHEAGTAEEWAMASAALCVAKQSGQAAIASGKAKKLGYSQLPLLNTLVELSKRADAARAVLSGNIALQTNNAEGLLAALQALERNDKLLFAERDAVLAQWKAATPGGTIVNNGNTVVSNTSPASGTDTIRFTDAQSLLAFPIRDGTWEVSNNQARTSGAASLLQRNDCTNVSSATVVFVPLTKDGVLEITFRGTTINFDFAREQFFAQSSAGRSAMVQLPIIPNIPYTVSFRMESGTMNLSVNANQRLSLGVGNLQDSLRISLSRSSGLALQQLDLQRQSLTSSPPVSSQGGQLLKQVFGWEAIGGSELRPPHIVLPQMAVGRSGIVRPITPELGGLRFACRGEGRIDLLLGDRTSDTFSTASVTLSSEKVHTIELRWTDAQVTVKVQIEGEPQANTTVFDNLTAPRQHVMIQAEQTLTILNPPELLPR